MPISHSDITAWLTTHLANKVGCSVDAIDVHAPFANLGLASVDALALAGALETWLGRPLSPTLIYDYTTIDELATYLATPQDTQEVAVSRTSVRSDTMPIAIVGMACRFPGAGSLAAYWELLRSGHDARSPWIAGIRTRSRMPMTTCKRDGVVSLSK